MPRSPGKSTMMRPEYRITLILLQQLAFTNANEDWNKALLTLRNLCTCDIADMVRACQNVGITAHNINSLAGD